ncbi:Phox/Bem1p [Artemisia annua]|uniref:Phox/Bem1p n=1 Tax=Artemisia annua TaxID=35608 RepID=A0A2U1PMV7_ARTAN|nr:Phox/Bem1p [Artemisia annua]
MAKLEASFLLLFFLLVSISILNVSYNAHTHVESGVLKHIIVEIVWIHVIVAVEHAYASLQVLLDIKMNALAIGIGKHMMVKHGETLRRFNASIDDNKLSLDIVMLQNKIRRLFFFESNVRFTLTYVDEDGDVITLATNDDLHDFVKQSLKPLRITVKLLYGTSATLVRTPEPVTLPAPSQPSYQRLVEHDLFLKRQKLPSPVEIIETTTYKMVQPTPTSGSHDGEKGANSKSSAYETMFI